MSFSLNVAGKSRQKKGGSTLAFGLNSRKQRTDHSNNVFGGDSSDDGSDDDTSQRKSKRGIVNEQIAREQAALRRRAQADLASVKDKSVYDYDGAYDSFQRAEDVTEKKEGKDPEKKSKYIGDLLKAAKVRERERDAIYERKNAKEQAIEDAEADYKGKEKFVTKSYKRKLQERKQWEAEQEEKEREEAANDVTKKSAGTAFAGFYGNLNRSAMMEQNKNDAALQNADADRNDKRPDDGDFDPTKGFLDGFERADQSNSNKEERNDGSKLPDDNDFDPRKGFLEGFERKGQNASNDIGKGDGTNLADNTVIESVLDDDTDKVNRSPKLSSRELREKKVAEARKRYLERKKALQLEQ